MAVKFDLIEPMWNQIYDLHYRIWNYFAMLTEQLCKEYVSYRNRLIYHSLNQ